MSEYKVACVHGRFQPPHRDHLEYIVAALEKSDHVLIGITQPDPTNLEECSANPHRAQPNDNPLSYADRCMCIQAMLVANGYNTSRFSFMPFPIDKAETLVNYVKSDIPCLTTIRDEWNVKKIEVLKEHGYTVDVLWNRKDIPGIAGTDIRRKIRENDSSWKNLVDPAVAHTIITEGMLEKICLASNI